MLKLMEEKPKMPVIRKFLLGLAFVIPFLVGFLGSFFYLKYTNKVETVVTKKPDFDIPQAVNLAPINYNILLLGYGGEGHDGGYLTDVLMVVNINPDTHKVHLFSIPRDLWVDVPVRSDLKEKHKINVAFAVGTDLNRRGEIAKEVIKDVTGLKMDYYLAVNFGNFEKIVNTLGGISVNVPVTFDDFFYPVKGLENETCGVSPEEINSFHAKYSGFELEKQFTCRYEHLHFDKGVSNMDGKTALKFVRSRHSDTHGGDFARSERQKALLLGISDKLISVSAVRSAKELFNDFSGLLQTDINIETFGGFIKLLGNLEQYQTSFGGLSTENVLVNSKSSDGQYILVSKEGVGIWKGVQEYVKTEIEK